jgi:protein-arginine kinase activator protein McsA
MKIIKKISFKRAKSLLEEYKSVQEKFSEIKNKGEKEEGIARIDSLSKLNYFIVLEYNNMADKIDYDKIFPNNDYIVDVEGLLNEQDKVIQHISKRKANYPEIFYKLGIIHEVTGCFLIATRKSDIKNLSTKNTKNTISVRIKNSSLPQEIEFMCNDYYDSRIDTTIKEQEEFKRFNKLSFEEQDIILQNILQNANSGSVEFFYYPEPKKTHSKDEPLSGYSGVKIEDTIGQNVERITSVEFLTSLLNKAIDKENYEFCAKIRDRIAFLSSK